MRTRDFIFDRGNLLPYKCCKEFAKFQNLQRISKIIPYMNKTDWKKINCPSGKDDCKTIDKCNPTIALNVLKK